VVETFLDVKESMSQYVVVRQQSVILTPKFEEKSSYNFMQSPKNFTLICGIGCLACQDEFYVNNSLDVKENYEHALDFAPHLLRLFWSW
jgi:hypothetical protein